jgi:[protein-PII] uridylyltransferase
VGRRIAERVGHAFLLSEEECNMVVFLVHRHLYLSHLAFRRDTSDPNLLVARPA